MSEDRVKEVNYLAETLTTDELRKVEEEIDPYDGLTSRQKDIARLKIRGLSQNTIAKVLNISAPTVSTELKKIRKIQKANGKHIDQDFVIGETTSVYQEVEQKAWEQYHAKNGDKLKALSLILQAREKQMKLYMDLGKVARAENKQKVEVSVSPFVQSWREGETQEVVKTLIESKLSQLPAPKPPEEEEVVNGELDDED